MRSFKVYWQIDKNETQSPEVRRFNSTNLSWDHIIKSFAEIFGEKFHPELRVQYIDSDGDTITISSELEWQEALRHFKKDNPIKLYIVEGLHPDQYFKDGPAPQPTLFYVGKEESEKQILEEPKSELKKLSFSIPQCLERLFGQGKILPYNLPEWLKSSKAVTVNSLPNREVDLDVNVPVLFDTLFKRGLAAMEQKNYDEAKQMFDNALSIDSQNFCCYYNLACISSLTNQMEAACHYLKQAVDLGYSNLQHLESDIDLNAIRSLDKYKLIVLELKYSSMLKTMNDMGFSDKENNIKMLQKTKGNLEQAIEQMLQ
jgi:hypothetical protein